LSTRGRAFHSEGFNLNSFKTSISWYNGVDGELFLSSFLLFASNSAKTSSVSPIRSRTKNPPDPPGAWLISGHLQKSDSHDQG